MQANSIKIIKPQNCFNETQCVVDASQTCDATACGAHGHCIDIAPSSSIPGDQMCCCDVGYTVS